MPTLPYKKIPPGTFVRRTSKAGMTGGAVLIGLALFMLFRGLGPGGPGTGANSDSSESTGTQISTSTSSPETTPTAEKSVAAAETVAGGITDDEEKALAGNVFTVLIDEHSYLMEIPGTPDPIFRPTPLPRILELAPQAKGDTNGIRVRILRRENARASAEFELKSELERIGIRSDAVMMPGEFVP